MAAQPKELMNRKEAAAYLASLGYPLAPATLARIAGRRKGPPFIRFGWRTVAYRREDLVAWARAESVMCGGPMVAAK